MPRHVDSSREFDFGQSVHVAPEAMLWASILCQAVADADGPRPSRPKTRSGGYGKGKGRSGSVSTGSIADIQPARNWLRGSSVSLALSLQACDMPHDIWRGRCLPRLEARWRRYDSEREFNQAIAAEAAGNETGMIVFLERAAALEMAGA